MAIYSSRKALVVGVSRYADPQYDLTYARSDAEAMAELLRTEFGFDQLWTLYDADATRQNIIRFFEHDLQRTVEDDGVLIFFAGHGITVTSAIGDDRGFLVPCDGDPKQPYANLSLTTIRDDYLPMIPAKHVFLIVDACYGGLALRDVQTTQLPRNIDDAFLTELTRRDRKVRQVLAAGAKDQRVLDGGLFGRSVFTGRLVEVLREADPHITADHAGIRVRERVARDSLDRGHRQTPQFGYLFGGDGSFVFSRRSRVIARPCVDEAIPPRADRLNAVRSWLSSHPGHPRTEWLEFLVGHLSSDEGRYVTASDCERFREEFLAQRSVLARIVASVQAPGISLASTIHALVAARRATCQSASAATEASARAAQPARSKAAVDKDLRSRTCQSGQSQAMSTEGHIPKVVGNAQGDSITLWRPTYSAWWVRLLSRFDRDLDRCVRAIARYDGRRSFILDVATAEYEPPSDATVGQRSRYRNNWKSKLSMCVRLIRGALIERGFRNVTSNPDFVVRLVSFSPEGFLCLEADGPSNARVGVVISDLAMGDIVYETHLWITKRRLQ